MLELREPEITLYAKGSEIAFRATTFTRQLNELVKSLSHRRWDYSEKCWYVLPQSYYQFIGGLKAMRIKVIADPSCGELVRKYNEAMRARLALKELEEVQLGLDSHFLGKLYPFQTVGTNFLYRCRRSILGDPVGLGKTPMAIAASIVALKESKIDFVFVVIPANLRSKWMRELEKFTNLKSVDAKLPRARRIELYRYIFESNERNIFYLVISYSTLTSDINEIMRLLKKSSLRYGIIFDEVQACKHRNSQRSQAANLLAEKASHLYGLSATYIEGKLEELYDVFKVVDNRVLGTYVRFFENHIVQTPWGKYTYKNLDRLKETTDPHVIRRQVERVGVQMPKEIYQEYMITLTPAQQSLYRSLIIQHMREFNSSILDNGNALVEMLRERQCCLSTELINPETHESPKLEALIEIIESLESDAKVVIFCHFLDMVEILYRELTKYGERQDPAFSILKLRSGMTEQEMDSIRKQFDEDPAAKILVTSDVSKEGHDLVAARHLIHFDLLWNPASMRQRAGRIIRITQKASQVVIHTLITRRTVEEYMWEILYNKGEIMKFIQDGGREESRVTRRAIMEILENYRG